MSRAVPTRYGRVAPLPADWRRGVEETYEFKTEVLESRDGTEHRSALRENPRYSLDQRTQAYDEEIRRFMADLSEGQDAPFYVPVTWRRTFLASAVSAGATALTVSEAPYWLVPGCRLAIFGGGKAHAADVLDVTAGNTVTLQDALQDNLPSGSTVYLAISARAQNEVDFRAETDSIWTGRTIWEQVPGADPWPAIPASPTLYAGHEVFLRQPNWRDTPRIAIRQRRETVDSTRGRVAVLPPSPESQLEFRLLYSGFDAATADDLLAFFVRMKGKRGAFWMPTWQNDLDVISGSGDILVTEGLDALRAYSTGRVLQAVAVRHASGAFQINRVLSAAEQSGDTWLTMAEAWTSPVASGATAMWCPLWRFATDRLEIERITGTVSEMSFSVLSLMREES